MIEQLLHHKLEWMVHLSQYRTPLWNIFFQFLNYFDSDYFYFVIIPIVWLAFSWKWGIRVYYLTVLSSLINYGLKNIFMLPRPCELIPHLNLVHVGEWSFPSGAAQGAMLFGGLLFYYSKSVWAKIIAILYIFLIGISRVYLGVHYPTDVLAGWIVGLALLFIFISLDKPIENCLKKTPFRITIATLIVIPLILLLIFYYEAKVSRLAGSALGIAVGLAFAIPNNVLLPRPKKVWEGIGRSLIGIVGIFFIYFTLKTFFYAPFLFSTAIQTFIIEIWLSLFASIVCKVLFKNYKI